MGLKELSQALSSRPELIRHPKGRPFEMNFPIIREGVAFEDGLDEALYDIICIYGDTQQHKTNVKANMTDWFMQKHHEEFQTVGDKAISIARKNSPHDVRMEIFDCWGAIYQKGDFTKSHDHWPHPWSFVYYVGSNGETPLIFPDAPQGAHYVYPKTGDMVLFPGWIRHNVPAHEDDSQRIIVAGNLNVITEMVNLSK